MNTLTTLALPPKPRATNRRASGTFWLVVSATALLAAALVLRFWQLGNIPGINGDEAWSGVQAMRLVRGEPARWSTPTGNPVNVFFLLPLAALHLMFEPSFVLLRSVALASGIAALAVNYALCRRAFDRRTAIVSTLLLAVLPINIAYSRFAWDASQSLLATVLVLYLPLIYYRKRKQTHADSIPRQSWGQAGDVKPQRTLPLAAMIALAAAILVHPTNVFAAPLLVVPIVFARRHELLQRFHEIALPARTWALALTTALAATAAYIAWLMLSGAVTRLHGPEDFLEFLQNYLRLLSGATVLEYIAGVDAADGRYVLFAWLPAACTLLFGAAAVVAAIGWLRRLAAEPDEADAALVVGWLVMVLGFGLVAGPEAIAPHFERYGICLVVPAAVVLARGWTWWLEPQARHARGTAWALSIGGWLLLAMIYRGYFDFIERTGGESHRAFRTGAVEPKQAALEHIISHVGQGRTMIVAAEWWNYWPLAYLASGVGNLDVACDNHALPGKVGGGPGTFWYVEFADSTADHEIRRLAAAQAEGFVRHVIDDFAGRPLLSVVGPLKKPLEKPLESPPENFRAE